MSTTDPLPPIDTALPPTAADAGHELAHLRDEWWCLVAIGAMLAVCGALAIVFPIVSSVGVTIAIGAMLLISGGTLVVSAFWTGKWSAFAVTMLIGILYLVVGMMIADSPIVSLASLTVLIASMFVVGGLFRVITALTERYAMWGWSLINGAVTTMLGVFVLRHFPEASLWLLGTLVGVDLLFSGVTWASIGLALRKTPGAV